MSARKPYKERAGYRASVRTGVDGGWVVIYDAEEQGISAEDGGRYLIVCETHATTIQTTSMPKARDLMHYPDEWCEGCAAAPPARAANAA